MSDKQGSRLLILRFNNDSELRNFFELWKSQDLGSLVKIGDDNDYTNNKESNKKETRFSKWGMKNLDNKNSEKPSLI